MRKGRFRKVGLEELVRCNILNSNCLSKEGDRFIYNLYTQAQAEVIKDIPVQGASLLDVIGATATPTSVSFRLSWPDVMELKAPGAIENPIEGYDDPHELLTWRFGADYDDSVRYRVLFGEYTIRENPIVGEFCITNPEDASLALVIVEWPDPECWPQQACLDSEYVARYGIPVCFFRRASKYIFDESGKQSPNGEDYWAIPKECLGGPYLAYIDEECQQRQELFDQAWAQYNQEKRTYRKQLQKLNDKYRSTIQEYRIQISWDEDSMSVAYNHNHSNIRFDYDANGVMAWEQGLQGALCQAINRRISRPMQFIYGSSKP